jgi:hypothetical protein
MQARVQLVQAGASRRACISGLRIHGPGEAGHDAGLCRLVRYGYCPLIHRHGEGRSPYRLPGVYGTCGDE